MLQIVPAIVITPGLEKVNPYARMGMIIGVLPSIIMKSNSTNSGGEMAKSSTVTESKVLLSGGVALGFTAAGGIDFNLSKHFTFFGELVFNGITYAPAKGKYKEYSVDGVDKLSSMKTKEKEWTFEKKYDADEVIPDDSQGKQGKISIDFSNVELNVGIKFKLGK
jgi:hypothetical protein